ncbi:restriction endonuclease [Microbulbifer sp.]|uniref:restriction endonuclease n=1 Tax=Microbulbifer sp. TaxID=1908541 RepID=UPI002588019E|nr:restriction endonuclease [Microbulbifer sp.]
MTKKWENYEDVAVYLLNQFSDKFGLDSVSGKQTVPGEITKTNWEIDGKGIRSEDGAIIIVECKRHLKSKQNQEVLGGLSYRIIDSGAAGGILVSPLGFQKGAKLVAEANNIMQVQLNSNSTNSEYLIRFLKNVCIGLVDSLEVRATVTGIFLTKVQ